MNTNLPVIPQAPFPQMPPVYSEHYSKSRITRSVVKDIIDRMNSQFVHKLPENVEEFSQHISYTEGLAGQFKDYYKNLLRIFFHYFKHLQFPASNLPPTLFMEFRMLKFFNGDKPNCIYPNVGILSNKESDNPPNSSDDHYTFKCDVKELVNLKCKDKILMLVSISNEGDRGHRNLLEIDNKTKIIRIVEPNNIIRSGQFAGYHRFFGPLGYTLSYYQHAYLQAHGGMCTLLADLNYFFPETATYEFIREKFIDYIEWELDNINSGVLSFGNKKSKFLIEVQRDIIYLKPFN